MKQICDKEKYMDLKVMPNSKIIKANINDSTQIAKLIKA